MNPHFNDPIIECRQLNLWYGNGHKALNNINVNFAAQKISALIGPSGCGKSTFLRCINRLNEEIPHTVIEGSLKLAGENIYARGVDATEVRRRVGMVFQQPNPFPGMSIFENVIAGVKLNKLAPKGQFSEIVENCLKRVGLWEEVKDKLHSLGSALSGGQQQRLCIARAMAPKPKVLLMDEPTSALDPIATEKIENLMQELEKDFTVIIVTHNMQQAKRISKYVSFFVLGELLEHAETEVFFRSPEHQKSQAYLMGQFG